MFNPKDIKIINENAIVLHDMAQSNPVLLELIDVFELIEDERF